jgi:predicted ribosome quality control (RQC) complex YloA/Tae2 family protein
LEGVFLSAVADFLDRRLRGRRCSGVRAALGDTLSLALGGDVLLLCARPGTPSLELARQGRGESLPQAAVWDDHLEGAVLESIGQKGLDRVLVLRFTAPSPYSPSGSSVFFEAAGRNANAVLVRSSDDRILADALEAARTPADVYTLLEGVGPSTAFSLLEESRISDRPLPDIVADLAEALANRRFEPWAGTRGPLPVRLGEGSAIEDLLAYARGSREDAPGDSLLEGFVAKVGARISECRRRTGRLRQAIEGSVPPSVYRNWGSLLLARAGGSSPGCTEALVKGWEGEDVRIPLRPLKTWKDNAERYFRKARNAEFELDNLRRLLSQEEERIRKMTEALEQAKDKGIVDTALAPPPGRRPQEKTGPMQKLLAPGWRCWIGRNAKENDEVTFRIGRRGDIWLHARGLSGAHVVLRCEGGHSSPPAAVLEQAAALAAQHAKPASEVMPVDYTMVQHVRKARGAGPGEVLYTGEKTLFIRLGPRRRTRLRGAERKGGP